MTGGWRLVRARRQAVPASVRRFAVRARRRRLRAAVPWLVVLGALAAFGACAGVLGFTSLLGVAEVRVVGASLVTPDQVRAAAAVRPGTPLVRVDTAAVADRVRRLPPVRSVTVSRTWPRTLTVRLVERTAVAVVPADNGARYLAIDETGTVFRSLPQRPAELPVVRLAAPSPSDPATRGALAVLGSLPAGLRGPLAALVADAPARIRLELTDGRTVIWGDATDNETKGRVALVLMQRPGTVFDVSAPYVPTIR